MLGVAKRIARGAYDLAETARSVIAPDVQTVWGRSGATPDIYLVEPEREEVVQIFEKSQIHACKLVGGPLDIIANGEKVGQKFVYEVEMTTGIARQVVVYVPTACEMMQFTIHMDTPWLTGVDGHNDRIAQNFMQGTGQPVILIGPENINLTESGLEIVKNIGGVAAKCSGVSLALAAQDSMQIASALAEKHELPRSFIQVGESRGAMIAPAKHPHGITLDIQNVYYDLTDPCIATNPIDKIRKLALLPAFTATSLFDMVPVAVDLWRKGELSRERGTVPMNPEYLGSAVLGTMTALLSGEAGHFPAYLPSDTMVHLLNFRRNPLAQHDEWKKLYGHTQLAYVNLKGAHLGLAYSSVQDHVIQRIRQFIAEYNRVGEVVSVMNPLNVHMRDTQSNLGPSEHMPEVGIAP